MVILSSICFCKYLISLILHETRFHQTMKWEAWVPCYCCFIPSLCRQVCDYQRTLETKGGEILLYFNVCISIPLVLRHALVFFPSKNKGKKQSITPVETRLVLFKLSRSHLINLKAILLSKIKEIKWKAGLILYCVWSE